MTAWDNDRHTVFVVDDDEAVCDALGMLLRAAGLRVETFCSASLFLKAYRPGSSACLILDIRMPGMSGLDLQDELYKRRISIPIIFLTGHGDVPMAVRALKKGAFDDGRKALSGRYDENAPDLASRLATLSEREREILERILEGWQTRQISQELHISVKTVEFHRAHIREKLGVASQAQLFSLFIPSEGRT